MKLVLLSVLLGILLTLSCGAKVVTLTVNNQTVWGPIVLSDEVSIGTNEVAEIQKPYGNGDGAVLAIVKNGITNENYLIQGPTFPMVVAGPATVRLTINSSVTKYWFCTVKIEPESFPPGQTIILPQGTVGVIHVESSTNLVQWQDEWVHTFSNTNDNRFFRLRAERSLP